MSNHPSPAGGVLTGHPGAATVLGKPHLSQVDDWRIPQRRRESRLRPVEDRVWMQWWDGEELIGRSGRLVNVSRNGAMIVTSAPLRPGHMLRIFLEEPAPQVGVTATVLQFVEGLKGVNQARLGFVTPCPEEFLEVAAAGFDVWLQR